jgi:hypothetical protein
MSEVAVVAAITGATSLLTSTFTGLITWAVSKNSSSVELAKVAAENERLLQANREDERRNRQSTYHQFIDVLNLLFQSLGAEVSEKEMEKVLTDYNHLISGVLLFGPPSVRNAAYDLNDVYAKIWPALAKQQESEPEKSSAVRWRDATASIKTEFGGCGTKLVQLMHADVTRGIAEDPSS